MRLLNVPAIGGTVPGRCCLVCGKVISLKRLARWQSATLCGSLACEHERKLVKARAHQKQWRERKGLDPAWRNEQGKLARARYHKAQRKKKGN